MTAYEIQALFENQLEIMRAIEMLDSNSRLSTRIQSTENLIKLIENQRRTGRQ